MSEMFSRDRFVGAVGSKFKLTADSGQTVDLELIEVSELRERPSGQSFSIFFAPPEGYTVLQGMFPLAHEELGTMDIFLVPVGDEKGVRLEALFNFLR